MDPRADEPMRAALCEREMQIERRINQVRAVVIVAAALTDLAYAAAMEILGARLLALAGLLLLVFVAYIALVRHWASGSYRPWLKYVTVTADYALTLLVFVGYREVDFFGGVSADAAAMQFVAFLLLLNMLSAFRLGARIVLFSTMVSILCGLYLAVIVAHSPLVAAGTPFLLAGSGWVAWMLAVGTGDLFRRLRRREMLARFLPRDVADAVESGALRTELGGVEQEVTVLMSDIRDFTHLAEERHPREVLALLNEYFTVMSRVVWAHGGTVDKFIGDGMLAVFGAPLPQGDHAVQGLQAALEMQRVLADLNEQWRRRGMDPVRMGVALHSGTVAAGLVGAPERLEYTVIGDAVNVTARIEELNRIYGTTVLVSETTRNALPPGIDLHPTAEVTVRGRTHPIAVYTPTKG